MAALARGRRAGIPIKHSYHAATASSTVADSSILYKKNALGCLKLCEQHIFILTILLTLLFL
jgi:hypothetical protein